MWEPFLTNLAGCQWENYSQKCEAMTHVVLFFIAMGSLPSRVKHGPCLKKYPSLVVFMENHGSPALWVPPQQALMLLIPRAEVLCDG